MSDVTDLIPAHSHLVLMFTLRILPIWYDGFLRINIPRELSAAVFWTFGLFVKLEFGNVSCNCILLVQVSL